MWLAYPDVCAWTCLCGTPRALVLHCPIDAGYNQSLCLFTMTMGHCCIPLLSCGQRSSGRFISCLCYCSFIVTLVRWGIIYQISQSQPFFLFFVLTTIPTPTIASTQKQRLLSRKPSHISSLVSLLIAHAIHVCLLVCNNENEHVVSMG